ncbi:hypothetical protein [Streptacidiphilus sp. EB103A]|uniref:hypothetical protein n=1 Tax=Streptacidiphilus sp. EB103A TaxID=3156275 RepID=UPI00351211E8
MNAGFVTFATTTADPTGHALQGFRLNAGVTQAKALQDLKQATSTTPSVSAAGITAATKDITAVGGATVDPATPVQVTIPLTAGTYYFLDFNQLFTPGHQVTLQTMQVTGAFDSDTPAHDQEIVQTTVNGRPRFTAPGTTRPASRTRSWACTRSSHSPQSTDRWARVAVAASGPATRGSSPSEPDSPLQPCSPAWPSCAVGQPPRRDRSRPPNEGVARPARHDEERAGPGRSAREARRAVRVNQPGGVDGGRQVAQEPQERRQTNRSTHERVVYEKYSPGIPCAHG